MPLPAQLSHRNVRQAGLAYVSNLSPTTTDPCYVPGSQDILTSITGYAERRPGFANSDATGFNNLQRIFTWDRFDGSFYKMYCDINSSGFAQVFKWAINTDVAPVSIYTDTSGTPFDFVVSNNTVYFSNGNVAKKWDPINGISNWGIAIGSVSNSSGPNVAGTGASVGTGVAWSNPGNVSNTGVSYATSAVTVAAGATNGTRNLQATNFSFSISPNNTVAGIQVSFNLGNVITGGGSGGFNNVTTNVNLLKNGVVVGSVRTSSVSPPSSPATITFGGTSDLWGATWTSNDINGTNFGVQIVEVVQHLGGTGSFTNTFSVNDVAVTIYGLGGPSIATTGSGSMTAYTGWQYEECFGNSNTGHVSSPTPGSNSTGPIGGAISTTQLAVGGKGYATNDTGTVSAGNFQGKYTVNSVNGAGSVLTYTISAAGLNYPVQNNIATAIGGSQPGSGSGFTINITAVTGVQSVNVVLTTSTDPQVNQLRCFRSTDSVATGTAAGVFFELPNSPFPNIGWTFTSVANASAGSTVYTGTPNGASGFASSVGQSFIVAGFTNGANNGTFPCTNATATTITLTNAGGVAETHAATGNLVAVDTASDLFLNISSIAPLPGFNDPPTPLRGPVYYSGRIWGFTQNKVVFSSLEENTIGVPEESFVSGVAGNFWNFDEPTQGLAVAGSANAQTLCIACGGRLYGIVGNSLDTFRKFIISNRRGCRSLTAIANLGALVAWLDSSNQVWSTDGSSMEELSIGIRQDLVGLTPSSVSMTFHVAGRFHWLVLSTGSKLFVYDMDTEQWMPPWSFAAQYVFSGETAPGSYQLFAATASTSLTLSTTAHNDNGATYQAIGQTNLFPVVPDYGNAMAAYGVYDQPTHAGYGSYYQVDTNAVSLSDFSILTDDDPLNVSSTYTSIFSTLIGPDVAYNRTQGTNLVQNVFSQTGPSARWVSMQWKGANADDALKVYGFFVAYKEIR